MKLISAILSIFFGGVALAQGHALEASHSMAKSGMDWIMASKVLLLLVIAVVALMGYIQWSKKKS